MAWDEDTYSSVTWDEASFSTVTWNEQERVGAGWGTSPWGSSPWGENPGTAGGAANLWSEVTDYG